MLIARDGLEAATASKKHQEQQLAGSINTSTTWRKYAKPASIVKRHRNQAATESQFNSGMQQSQTAPDAKENSDTSFKTSTCTSSGCTKKAYIFDQKFVGYSESDYTASISAACATSLTTYLDGLSETADPEIKSNLANCGTKNFYICNRQSQATETEWKACKIQREITNCEIELNQAREGGNGEFTVTGKDYPRGRTYYIATTRSTSRKLYRPVPNADTLNGWVNDLMPYLTKQSLISLSRT